MMNLFGLFSSIALSKALIGRLIGRSDFQMKAIVDGRGGEGDYMYIPEDERWSRISRSIK
jgi:hypothetical protein